jgi:hypothetical protein
MASASENQHPRFDFCGSMVGAWVKGTSFVTLDTMVPMILVAK